MGKMFYTMDETKAALGKNEEELKQLSREGKLREFRDGPRIMFKADQVDALKAEMGDSIALSPAESGAPISLAGDSRAGGSGLIGLADSTASKSKPGTGLANLAGSPGLSGSGLSGSAAGAPRGITIFDVDDSQNVDPSAQTAIHSSIPEQVTLESAGSGSGLLDLTRESDETSLGAVFDEISPSSSVSGVGGRGATGGASAISATAVGVAIQSGSDRSPAVDRSVRGPVAAPIYVEAPDALGAAVAGASIVATAVLCFGGYILGASLLGYRPEILDTLAQGNTGMMYLAAAGGAALLFAIVGLLVGKATSK